MSYSDREHWTIDDWRNYALKLEKDLKRKPKKRGAPRKHPKEFVGAVMYRIVAAKLEGNKLTAKEALKDELNKRNKGKWRAEKEYRAVLNEVSNRKDLRSALEALLVQSRDLEAQIKDTEARIKEREAINRHHEANRFGLADAVAPNFIRTQKS
ncbi:hypothetical protein [Methylomicrobium lacus]|uniref:hypothetical protein n=1 Tax=Methylomicrobium lacus TaxID=136992 RepID=UPI0035A96C63